VGVIFRGYFISRCSWFIWRLPWFLRKLLNSWVGHWLSGRRFRCRLGCSRDLFYWHLFCLLCLGCGLLNRLLSGRLFRDSFGGRFFNRGRLSRSGFCGSSLFGSRFFGSRLLGRGRLRSSCLLIWCFYSFGNNLGGSRLAGRGFFDRCWCNWCLPYRSCLGGDLFLRCTFSFSSFCRCSSSSLRFIRSRLNMFFNRGLGGTFGWCRFCLRG
jgi:hypothetical protein